MASNYEDLDKKKYKPLENILNDINKKFISLDRRIQRRNNKILKEVLKLLIEKMKERDNLFNKLYEKKKIYYGGSYYNGLRVGQPDEFDLDLLLTLPKISKPLLSVTNKPGFVQIKLTNYLNFKQNELFKRYKDIEKLLEDEKDCYLDNEKVRNWMESVINLALNCFSRNGKYVMDLSMGTFYPKIRKSGPAVTLILEGVVNNAKIKLNIDFVTGFQFNSEEWPKEGFRPNPVSFKRPIFFIVPKRVEGVSGRANRYWRLSFQEQENELIKLNFLKPTVKLLKKMRYVLKLKSISSYYIKNIALWEQRNRNKEFWSTSLSYVFMTLLKEFHKCLKNKEICYFWNKNNNLLDDIGDSTLNNMENQLKHILDDIDMNVETNPKVIIKYLLTRDEQLEYEFYLNTLEQK